MRKPISLLMLAVLLAVLPAAGVDAACPPGGYCGVYLCNWFNWTSNGDFSSGSSCWTLYGGATVKNDGQNCSPGAYVELNSYSTGLSQVVHIPGPGEPGYINSAHPSHFEFDYKIQFLDPHHDAYNQIAIGLYDNNTGALLQWITSINGANGNPNCGLTYLDFTNPALLGKNVRIDVQARVAYPDTKIRITGIALWQEAKT